MSDYVSDIVTVTGYKTDREAHGYSSGKETFNLFALRPTSGSENMKPLMTSLIEEDLDDVATRINAEHKRRMADARIEGAQAAIKEITGEIVGRVAGDKS